MKLGKLILLIAVLTSVIGCGKAVNQTALEALGLKGKVKTIEEKKYAPADKDIANSKDSTISYAFINLSRKGNIESKKEQKENEVTLYDHTFEYNKYNEMVEQRSFYPDGAQAKKWVNEYNEIGHWINRKAYDSIEQMIQRWVRVYDEKGNLIADTVYASNNGIIQYNIYEYDEENREIDQKIFDGNNSQVCYFDNVYNDEDLLTEVTVYNPSGNMLKQHKNKYNEKGQCVEIIITDLMPSVPINVRIENKYDQTGNWIETIVYEISSGKIKSIAKRDIVYY